jgi:hypothetical protein
MTDGDQEPRTGRWFRILLLCQERPTRPKPSHRCHADASGWSPITVRLGRRTAPSRLPGAGHGGRRMAAATGSRPARAPACTGRGQQHGRLASRRVALAGAEVQVYPAALPVDLVNLALAVVLAAGPRTRAAPRPEGAPGGLQAGFVLSCAERSEPSAVSEPRLSCSPWHPIFCRMALDHPFDHPDDPSVSVWSRLDRRCSQREQARSVWSRPVRRRASVS